jgi:hypothetical protein
MSLQAKAMSSKTSFLKMPSRLKARKRNQIDKCLTRRCSALWAEQIGWLWHRLVHVGGHYPVLYHCFQTLRLSKILLGLQKNFVLTSTMLRQNLSEWTRTEKKMWD